MHSCCWKSQSRPQCKTQIDVQSSNPCPISTSQTSQPQIYVFFFNSQIGIQFSNICPFPSSLIGVKFSDLWPFLTLVNRRPMTSLMYSIILTNCLTCIWEFRTPIWEYPLNWTMIWDNDISECRFQEWTPIWVRTLIWVYHIYNTSYAKEGRLPWPVLKC